ncbi:peptide ABC transporter substrate-binding protein [Candidatus Neptunochlamydia vexilliferae]|uniref:Oligopeptide-binding protein OppA n=1 Tax=Candidatus Neptunichlamydia vexilliferae TaxID=1651774 RepID=A0ABS0B3H3_9BACT|nr:peptide ABC transporter substrate-binding protein [Candidatus Neptunochlamydia vexilliferae]MBF5060145.1 Oligopeptide-binding protein OppA [Candidatus Neptunochlamydia vexilliferae]
MRLLLIPLLVFALTGCKRGASPSSQDNRQQITINIKSEPQTLDPRKARALTDINLIRMFMDGLTRIDKMGNPSLALAKKVDVSADKKTYTFTLRDCKWSNGDKVTAQDFAYAWKKSLTPSFNAPNANMLYVIKNAKEAKLGNLPLSLVGIEVRDEKTLVVTLNHPTPYFLELTANPIYFPVNSHVDRANSHWAEKEITYVGNGPFLLQDWKHHNAIEAKKNNGYWDQRSVSLSGLKMVMMNEGSDFNIFDSNDLSWEGSPFSRIPVDALETLKSINKLHSTPVLATKWIRINIEKAPFESNKLRKALALAINRKSIVEHVTQGKQLPATGIVPSSMGLQQTPYFEDGDVETAQKLFNEALNEMGIPSRRFPQITLTFASSQRSRILAQAIQSQWREAFGIEVKLEPAEHKVFFDRISKKDYTLALSDWLADFNDPINFLEVFKTKHCGTNNTNWESLRYYELLEASLDYTDIEARKEFLRKSEAIIMDEMPVIPIFYFTMLYVQDDHLKDVVLTTMGNIDFKWAHVE